MKQVFKSNLGITVQDVPLPALGDKQVLIKCREALSAQAQKHLP